MAENILIIIQERRAQVAGGPVIVCGNSDYTITFDFDSDWNLTGPKTARFVYVKGGKVLHEDKVFSGDTVNVPVLSDVGFVDVGVFAGDLCTTTPARIRCKKSILCGSGEVHEPTPDVYAQIMALFNEMAEQGAFGATEEQAQQIEANKQNIEKLTNGTTPAGDAAKLGGKDASEYFLSSGTVLNTSILEYALTVPNGTHFIRLGGNSHDGADLPHANYRYSCASIEKRSATQLTVVLWGMSADHTFKVNHYTDGVWSGWKGLSDYLPLSGGKVSGNIEIVIDTPNQRIFRIKNSVKDIYLTVNASGEFGFYDNTLRQYVFSSAPDGTKTFNGTASGNLPLSGGTIDGRVNVSASDYAPLLVTNKKSGGASFSKHFNGDGVLGFLGFHGKNQPGFKNAEETKNYDLLHTGNSAKVAIQETAPTDGLWVW